ncbi:MAG: hypothetical protein DCF20_10815 [Pseudanabaena sp.]|nr:MAG: hypothetical protein DCF20_10815 [Pseudanabaena sp.]
MEVLLKKINPQEWENVLTQLNSKNLLFQSLSWHQVLIEAYGFEIDYYAAIDVNETNGNVIGAIAICQIISPQGIKYVSLPFSDYAGIIGINSESILTTVIALQNLVNGEKLIVRASGEQISSLESQAEVIREGYLHYIDLTQTEEALLSQLSKGFCGAVRQAEKFGVIVKFDDSEAAFQRFWSIHAQLRRHKFNEIPQSRHFFDCLFTEFALKGKGGIVEAWHGDRCIAGILYLIVGDRVYYKFAASLADALEIRPNNLLLWQSILEFRRQGFLRYELGLTGGSDAYAGLRFYKLSSGAVEIPLKFLAFNHSSDSLEAQSWQKFMQNLTNAIAQDPEITENSLNNLSRAIYQWLA